MTKQDSHEYAQIMANLLTEKKAKDVMVIDVEEVTPLFDFLVIADADSLVHLNALANFVKDKMDELKIQKLNPSYPNQENPWILIDCGFMVIHLFTEETRNFYSLEKLWVEGKIVFDSSKMLEQEVLA